MSSRCIATFLRAAKFSVQVIITTRFFFWLAVVVAGVFFFLSLSLLPVVPAQLKQHSLILSHHLHLHPPSLDALCGPVAPLHGAPLVFSHWQQRQTTPKPYKPAELPSSPPLSTSGMSANPSPGGNLDRYVVIHVATTCDEHGVYVTKDSAEVIEFGWILLDAKSCEEVRLAPCTFPLSHHFPNLLAPSPRHPVSSSALAPSVLQRPR